MKLIPLTQGKFALVDDEDFESLSRWKWHYHRQGYAVGWVNKRKMRMHRPILGLTPKDTESIDHKDGDGLNNRRENIRICTPTENMRNRKRGSNNKSGYKGVNWQEEKGRWRAELRFNGKSVYLGTFVDKEKAHAAYREGAKKYFGDYARLE